MCNYAEIYQGVRGYNEVYNVFLLSFYRKKLCDLLFESFFTWERGFPKRQLLNGIDSFLAAFHCRSVRYKSVDV